LLRVPGRPLDLVPDEAGVTATSGGVPVARGTMTQGRAWFDLVAAPVDGAEPDGEALAAVVTHLVDRARRMGDRPPRWVVSAPGPVHDETAARAGLVNRRDLVQLRRRLPVEDELRSGLPAVAVRPFRPGVDEEALVETNNRAFAAHPDQAGLTVADLFDLETRHWFDPHGFLLLDADPADADAGTHAGPLAGFCWTKVHDDDRPVGEIYVIGVDPAAGGRGLGKALTVAGLDWLHRARGITEGMLYVDVANTGAVAMYAHLGFTPHHLDRVYSPATG
jgi:mycothiol synthase